MNKGSFRPQTTKTGGLVVDGAVRDLEGIGEMMMPAYFRKTHPSAISNVTLTGINVPVRIGNVTVMPGDLVVGDPEGVYFVPPQLVQPIVDNADTKRTGHRKFFPYAVVVGGKRLQT